MNTYVEHTVSRGGEWHNAERKESSEILRCLMPVSVSGSQIKDREWYGETPQYEGLMIAGQGWGGKSIDFSEAVCLETEKTLVDTGIGGGWSGWRRANSWPAERRRGISDSFWKQSDVKRKAQRARRIEGDGLRQDREKAGGRPFLRFGAE